MADRTPLLALTGVRKRYGAVTALDGVSFSLERPAFVVLLGRNGAGKSTLVQLVSGLFTPDEGTVRVLGHDMAREPTAALSAMGIVFQAQTLDPELSVRANLLFQAGLHGLPRRLARDRIAALLDRFGLADMARKPARHLSGGNRRRLELARALLHGPRVLVMDEATVGLDHASRQDLLDRILALPADEGVLVLWTTHLLDEAERAERLLFLDRGRLVFDGTREAALQATAAGNLATAYCDLAGGSVEAGAPE